MLAASRAPGGMPSRLPIEPGEAAMIACCCSRVSPSHQALTSSGEASGAGLGGQGRVGRVGDAAVPPLDLLEGQHPVERLAHRLLLGHQVGRPRCRGRPRSRGPAGRSRRTRPGSPAASASVAVWAARSAQARWSDSRWPRSLDQRWCVGPRAAASCRRGRRRGGTTPRSASDIASAVRPIGRIDSWYDVERERRSSRRPGRRRRRSCRGRRPGRRRRAGRRRRPGSRPGSTTSGGTSARRRRERDRGGHRISVR